MSSRNAEFSHTLESKKGWLVMYAEAKMSKAVDTIARVFSEGIFFLCSFGGLFSALLAATFYRGREVQTTTVGNAFAALSGLMFALGAAALLDRRRRFRQVEAQLKRLSARAERGENKIDSISRLLPPSGFWDCRKDGPKMSDYLELAQEEITFVTFSFRTVDELLALIEKTLKRIRRMDILILNPGPPNSPNPLLDGVSKVVATSSAETLHNEIHNAISSLMTFKKRLATNRHTTGLGGKLHVKLYDVPPTMSLILVDTKAPHGRIRIEPVPYNTWADHRPVWEFQGRYKDDIYHRLVKSYGDLVRSSPNAEDVIAQWSLLTDQEQPK